MADRRIGTALEQLQHSIIQDCADAIVAKTISGTIVSWNAAAERLFGYCAEEALGHSIMMLVPPDRVEEENGVLARLRKGEQIVGLETSRQTKDGRRIAVTLTISPLYDGTGNVIGACKIARPMSAQGLTVEQLMELAFRDSLTGLANRTLFRERLTHSMRKHERSRYYGGILFIDLDNFKSVNDSAGHVVGDELLQQCGLRLRDICRDIDTVTRWGGDEFVVLIEDICMDRLEALQRLHAIGNKLLEELRKPYIAGAQHFTCPPSIGGCLFEGVIVPVERALETADRAMYEVKRNGRNGLRIANTAQDAAMQAMGFGDK